MKNINQLVKKLEIQEKNRCETDNTMMEILKSIPSMSSEEWNQMNKADQELLESKVGKLSPFFFREVEQFRDLIMEEYRLSKQQFNILLNDFTHTHMSEFYDTVTIIDTACGKFMELLLKRAREYSCQDIEVPRLAPVFDHFQQTKDVSLTKKMLMDQLQDAYKAMDLLLCPETFDELLDMERTDHYWTYANYFFAEYTLFYEPAMFLSEVDKKETKENRISNGIPFQNGYRLNR